MRWGLFLRIFSVFSLPLLLFGVVAAVLLFSHLRAGVPSFGLKGMALGILLLKALFPSLLLCAVAAFWVVRRFNALAGEIEGFAGRLARGDFDARVEFDGWEASSLSRALNLMAEELGRLVSVLRERGEQFEKLLSFMSHGVCAVDLSGRVYLFNQSFRGMVGMDPSGRPFWEVVEDYTFCRGMREALAGRGSEAEFEWRGRCYLGTFSPVEGAGALAVLKDVTLQRRAEGMKRELVAGVSHELRTPLTAMKGYLELLREDLGEEAGRRLDVVERHLNRLIGIVEDLVTLSRLESPSVRLEKRRINLADVVESVCRLWGARAAEKGVELVFGGSACVFGDPFVLEQVVANLVDNAVKYTDSGGRVEVRVGKRDGWAVLEVEDTGCGIPREHLDRIFERFYVVDKSRSRRLGGTGLGLSIVKHAVSLHGGRVEVRSKVGKGSIFTVFLPLTEN